MDYGNEMFSETDFDLDLDYEYYIRSCSKQMNFVDFKQVEIFCFIFVAHCIDVTMNFFSTYSKSPDENSENI